MIQAYQGGAVNQAQTAHNTQGQTGGNQGASFDCGNMMNSGMMLLLLQLIITLLAQLQGQDQGGNGSNTNTGGTGGNTNTGGTGGNTNTGGTGGNTNTGGTGGNTNTGGTGGNTNTGGTDGNTNTGGTGGNTNTGGTGGNTNTGGTDGNTNTGGTDGNTNTGGTDGNTNTGGTDGNTNTGGTDGNTNTGGTDGNTNTGGTDGNTNTGGTDGNTNTGGTGGNTNTGGTGGNTNTGGTEECGNGGNTNNNPVGVDGGSKIWGDPHFVGAEGGKYDVQGEAGKTYNILSDQGFQVNSQFSSWGGNGATVMGTVGATMGQDQVEIKGNGDLFINGEAKGAGTYELDGGTITKEGKNVTMKTDEYEVTAKSASGGHGSYLNLDFASDNVNADGIMPHGLWGQTADGDGEARNGDKGAGAQGGGAIEKLDGSFTEKGDKDTVQLYETDGLFDTGFEHFNQFNG